MTLPSSGSIALSQVNAELGYSSTVTISLNDTAVRNLAGIASGAIGLYNLYGKSALNTNQKGAFYGGYYGGGSGQQVNTFNLLSTTGTISADQSTAGTARFNAAGVNYGTNLALMTCGNTYYIGAAGGAIKYTNYITSSGTIGSDNSTANTARTGPAGATYGKDKGIILGGYEVPDYAVSTRYNTITNTGTVSSDSTYSGTARYCGAAYSYGSNFDKAIYAYGGTSASSGTTTTYNLITNTGTIGTDAATGGTARMGVGSAGYGGDKAAFYSGEVSGYDFGGYTRSFDLVSNTGTLAVAQTSAGFYRAYPAGAGYGGDKGTFYGGYAGGTSVYNSQNLLSNVGVIASNTTGGGSARGAIAGASYG